MMPTPSAEKGRAEAVDLSRLTIGFCKTCNDPDGHSLLDGECWECRHPKPKHHPSCRESDKDLVWHCAQCGLNEPADSLVASAPALLEACKLYLIWDEGGHPIEVWESATTKAKAAIAQATKEAA